MRPVTRPVLFRFCCILLVNLVFGVPFVSFWFFLVLRPHVADEVMVGLYVYMTPTNVFKRQKTINIMHISRNKPRNQEARCRGCVVV